MKIIMSIVMSIMMNIMNIIMKFITAIEPDTTASRVLREREPFMERFFS